jgi:hypothetical protein
MIYNLIYHLYSYKLSNSKLDRLYNRVIIRFANLLLPRFFKLTRSLSSNKLRLDQNLSDDSKKYIVSLTTFPSRIDSVWLTIESILRQEVKPDTLILWLYEGEFNGKASLPKELLEQEKRGLQIKFCQENLMPHKKYFYTMLANPKANVITVDDDILYPSNLLKNLIAYHHKDEANIICTLSRKINESSFSDYSTWNYVLKTTEGLLSNLPIGVGAVLYPPNSLNSEVFNLEVLKDKALRADDLWLKIMGLLQKTKVVCIGGEYNRLFMPLYLKDDKRLMDENIGEGQNDTIFKSLIEHYNIPISIFQE